MEHNGFILDQPKSEELARCMEIIDDARAFQRQQGFVQWEDGRPNMQTLQQDLAAGRAWVLRKGNAIVAYMAVCLEGEPVYAQLDHAWQYHGPHAAVHRVAIDGAFRGQGVARSLFALAEQLCKENGIFCVRIDTMEANTRMQHVLERSGYVLRGEVVYPVTGSRLAYEKILP